MPAARILRSLDGGAMMTVAFTLSREERLAVSSYLGTREALTGPPAAAFCTDRTVRLSVQPSIAWNGWSPAASNARFQTQAAAGLSADQIPKLKLRWAFGFDGDVSAFSQPTVLEGYVFVGSAAGVVHAMRADSGCLTWTFQANGPVRAAIVAVPMNGRHVLLFGDMTGWFYAVQAETGALPLEGAHRRARFDPLTAAATAHEGVVYVPVSSWEEARASDATYPCCTFRGSVVALRIQRRQPAMEDLYGRSVQGDWQDRDGGSRVRPGGCRRVVDAHRGCQASSPLRGHRWQLLNSGHGTGRRGGGAGPSVGPRRLVEAVHAG